MSTQLQLASIMAPGNQAFSWYSGVTGDQVSQYLTQNNAMLTSLNPYIDADATTKLAAVMAPRTGTGWWWYYGVTASQVSQFLTQHGAQPTQIRPYIDTDNTLKFAVIMAPRTGTGWWWYYDATGNQVSQYLTQNSAQLTHISAYIDNNNTLKFAVIMVPRAGTGWWWYSGITADSVNQYLTHNRAQLTDVSAYVDIDNTLKFAVIMAPGTGAASWWYYGAPTFIGQQLTQNKARPIVVSPYLWSAMNSITVDTSPNISGLDGSANVTIERSGAFSFSGGWSPSNFLTGLAAQDVSYSLGIRDNIRRRLFVFSVAGTVPVEGSLSFNYNGINRSLAANWTSLSAGYRWQDNYSAYLEFGVTVTEIVNWFESNEQTISEVISVVGELIA